MLWSLRGLSWRELAKRTARKSWEHEVFGQAARLAFYYFLGIFPALLLLLVFLNTLSSAGSELRNTLLDYIQEIVPAGASALLGKTLAELNLGATVAAGALWAVPSAAWAIFNGTWAMMVGLNNAYGVKEERSWWRILTIGLGLTMSLAIMGLISLAAMLYGSRAGAAVNRHLGFHTLAIAWHSMQWLVIILLLLFSFALLYRFAPNLKDRRWQWSTPGGGGSRGVVGRFNPVSSHFSGTFQLFPKDLCRYEAGDCASAVAVFHGRGYFHWRRD